MPDRGAESGAAGTPRACDISRAYTGLEYASLRYFNAAGASRERGEHHRVETHLIPRVLEAAAGVLPYVDFFGIDYPAPDGTCVRDSFVCWISQIPTCAH